MFLLGCLYELMISTKEQKNMEMMDLNKIKLVFAECQHKRTLVCELINAAAELCYCYDQYNCKIVLNLYLGTPSSYIYKKKRIFSLGLFSECCLWVYNA